MADEMRKLTALPSGLAATMNAKSGHGSSFGKKKKAKSGHHALARDGVIVSKMFNPMASRPYPRNGLSLEQMIMAEFTNLTPTAFLVSSAVATTSTFASKAFALSQFNGATAMASVFDQYKIFQIECWLDCTTPNVATAAPTVSVAVDLDDANLPTASGQILDKLGATTAGGLSSHYHKWRPHTAVAVYSGAFTSFANSPSQWIDAASPNVEHYGLKATAVSNGVALQYSLTWRAVIGFRAPVIN